MAYIRCYDPSTSDTSSPKGFVVYSDNLVQVVAKQIEKLLSEANLETILDTDKLRLSLTDLRAKRKNLVRVKARTKLGKHEGLLLDRGSQDFMDCDDFEASMHPMGVIMEAAKKAAYGMTTPAPEGTIDGRMWYTTRRFVVECPEEIIIIDSDEMDDDIKRMVLTSKKTKSLSSIMSSVLDARTDIKPEVSVLKQIESKIRTEVQRETGLKTGAGRIVACIIEIQTSKHASDNGAGVAAKKIRDQENQISSSISEAISKRISMRLQSLSWSNHDAIVYVLTGD